MDYFTVLLGVFLPGFLGLLLPFLVAELQIDLQVLNHALQLADLLLFVGAFVLELAASVPLEAELSDQLFLLFAGLELGLFV